MVFLYWYIVVGVLIGVFAAYKMVNEYGWEFLCEDFNAMGANQKNKIVFTAEEFKIAFPLGILFLAVLTWPYFVYVLFKNYLK